MILKILSTIGNCVIITAGLWAVLRDPPAVWWVWLIPIGLYGIIPSLNIVTLWLALRNRDELPLARPY